MTREHATRPADEAARAPRPAERPGPTRPSGPGRVLALQQRAGNAAVASMVGRGGPPVVQRFEAQHHEHVERASLTAPTDDETGGGGATFTDAESTATYFGNWSRDMSQAFVGNPVVATVGEDLVFEILNAMAIKKFGRQISAEDFGVYSPREHIDNPAGQINADLLLASHRKKIGGTTPGTPDEDISGTGGGGSAPERAARLQAHIAAQFTVNAAGLPAYLGRSQRYVLDELGTAADLGRGDQQAFMHLGNALHTVEDLFAHSNYLEIAVGKLFTDGKLPVSPELAEELSGRTSAGKPAAPVDTMSGVTTTGRPILTTGTFVSTDTKISLSEALSAFLAELTPMSGSAANDERSQHTTMLLLSRYEQLAEQGTAGKLARGFVERLAPQLQEKLADAARTTIGGEAPGEDAALWQQGLSWARRQVGAVAGAAASGLGGLLGTSAVQGAVGGIVNAVGNLDLTGAHAFVCKQGNRIDTALDHVHQVLRRIPGYLTHVKPWIEHQRESLRDLLRAPITAAIRFSGQLLQRAFAEQEVQSTNIARQIEQQIQENVRSAEALAQLRRASPPQQIAMLLDPTWVTAAKMSDADAERLAAMIALPEYVKAGPSHSQIAKDHADSPFFGTAAALAMHADARLRDRIVAVWAAEGRNTPHPDLTGNYADEATEVPPDVEARRPPPGKPESEWTADERVAERSAATHMPHHPELTRRLEGERLRREGTLTEAEEDHGVDAPAAGLRALARSARALPGRLQPLADQVRAMAGQLADKAPRAAARLRRAADGIPAGLDTLADRIERAGTAEELAAAAAAVREVAHAKEGLVAEVQAALAAAADEVEHAGETIDSTAESLRHALASVGSHLTVLADGLERMAEALTPHGDVARTTEQLAAVANLAPVPVGRWDPSFAPDGAGARAGSSPERAALLAEARELLAHPYDTSWWEAPLLAWCAANQERLEAYIRARNAGAVHHHPGH